MRHVYKRLQPLQSKLISQSVSMVFLVLWHGLHVGYLINFSFEVPAVLAEQKVCWVRGEERRDGGEKGRGWGEEMRGEGEEGWGGGEKRRGEGRMRRGGMGVRRGGVRMKRGLMGEKKSEGGVEAIFHVRTLVLSDCVCPCCQLVYGHVCTSSLHSLLYADLHESHLAPSLLSPSLSPPLPSPPLPFLSWVSSFKGLPGVQSPSSLSHSRPLLQSCWA